VDRTREFLQRLVAARRLTPAQAQAALEHGQRRGVSPLQVLVEQHLLEAHEIPTSSGGAPLPVGGGGVSQDATLAAGTPGLGLGLPPAGADTRATPPRDRGDSSQARTRALPEEVAVALAEGKTLGRYAILGELGRGGMGVVYRGYDPELRRPVAIKQLLPRPGEAGDVLTRRLRRFQQEGQAAAKLNHPGIVGVLEIGESKGQPFMVMDFVEGQSLEEVLEGPELTPRRICELVREAAEGLGHAHAQGIVHRDVKPANILVDHEGHARLTDFGLARDMDLVGASSLSQAGQILGTPHFLSPEQARGKPELTCPASDVFALGGVLYLALTGALPFDGTSLVQLLGDIVYSEPTRPREVSPQINRDLETLILKCLAKEPERRYPDGAAVARELERFLAGEAIEARPLGGRERLWRLARRNKALTAVILTSLLTLVTGGLYSVIRIRSERDAAESGRVQAEAARSEALAAREQALTEGERARAAEARAQANAARIEREVEVSRLQIARALREKGQRLADLGFYNDAAALFAESLQRLEDPQTRGLLAHALIKVHPAAYDPPPTRTCVLPVGGGGYLVGSTLGTVRGLEGAPTLPTCSSSVRALVQFRDKVVAGLAEGSVVGRGMADEGEWAELARGSTPVIALAVSPSGDRLAAVWDDGSLRVTGDLSTWTEVAKVADGSPSALTWGTAGLALGDTRGALRVFRGDPLAEWTLQADVHSGGVAALAWVGPKLASLGYEGSLVRSSTLEALKVEGRVEVENASLALIGVGEDEVAIGLRNGAVEHRRLSDFHPVREFILGNVPVRCLSVDERYSYAGGQGISSRFDLQQNVASGGETREAIYRLPGPGQENSLEVSAGGAVTWRGKGHKPRQWAMPSFPTTLARSSTGELAASGDSKGNVVIETFDRSKAQMFAAHPKRPIVSLRFARQGRLLLTACSDELAIWDTNTREAILRRPFKQGRSLLEASLDDDGRYGARFSDGVLLLMGGRQPEVSLTEVVAGPCFAPANPRDPTKGRRAVWVATTDGITQVLGQKLLLPVVLNERAAPIQWLRVSRDGEYLLYSRKDGVASLYRTFGTKLSFRIPVSRASAWPPELDVQSGLLSATSRNGAAGLWSLSPNRTGTSYYSRLEYTRLLGVGPTRFVAAASKRKVFEHRVGDSKPLRTLATPGAPTLLSHAPERDVLGVCGTGFLAEYQLRDRSGGGSAYQLPSLRRPLTMCYWPPLQAWMIGSVAEPELLVVNNEGKWRKQLANEARLAAAFLSVDRRGFSIGAAGRLDVLRGPRAEPSLPQQRTWTFGDARLVTGAVFGEGETGFCITSWSQGRRAGPNSLDSLRGELWFLGGDVTQRRISHAGMAISLVRSGDLMAWVGGRSLYLYDSGKGALRAVIPNVIPEFGGTAGLVFLNEGRHLVSLFETRYHIQAWQLDALALLDPPAKAVARVARLTRLRVAGLEVVNQPDEGEYRLAQRLAAR
jgi:protein kinase-like protein